MIIKTLATGPLEANCYVIADEESGIAMIIDPGDEPDRILELADEFRVKYLVLTHAHFDHVGAVADLKEATGGTIALHHEDVAGYAHVQDQAAFWGYKLPPLPPPDLLLNEGDGLDLGGTVFTVIHTPGHTPGGICLYSDKVVLTGDTLFAGSVGRTDFPGGSMKQMKESFRRLMSLPDDTTVLCGHGAPTSIGREKTENMFVTEFLYR